MARNSRKTLLLVSGLIGLGVGALGYAAVDVPTVAEARPQHLYAANAVVDDPHELLTAADRQRLVDGAAALTIPEDITDLHFMVFRTNHRNILDDVKLLLRDHYPQLIDDSNGANGFMRDGVLVIGVGLDPRQAFAYASQDVGDVTGMTDESRLEDILDAMKRDVKADDLPSGLLQSARAAADADSIAQWRHNSAKGEKVAAGIGGAVGAFGLSTAFGTASIALRDRRRKRIATAPR